MSSRTLLRRILLFAVLLSAVSGDTQINFPSFSPHDNIETFGDVAYNPTNGSYIMNVGARTNDSTGSCGSVMYMEKVRIQDVATGRMASFNTSFSFTFTTHGVVWDQTSNTRSGSVLAFMFFTIDTDPQPAMRYVMDHLGQGTRGCESVRSQPLVLHPPGFYLYIDTDYNSNHEQEPSNNFIRIGKNLVFEYDVATYTHNFCGNDTHCSYFSNGRCFTAWIDFNSLSQTLEVRLANGSGSSVKKPLQPLLLISNYTLAKELTDEVYLAFWGSSEVNHLEEHELLSWSFFSSGIPEPDVPLSQMLSALISKLRTWIGILGTIVAALVILLFISWFTRTSRIYHHYATLGYSIGPHVFSYYELQKATNNFDQRNMLGHGASGIVYKGSLEGDTLIAVKVINFSDSKQTESLFHAEVSSLGQVRHRNVVELLGWCQDKGRLLLVYAYMPNGSLNEWIHKSGSHFQQGLSLKMRHSILQGVGAALEYLHEDCLNCILHRDIKSSNVLLDAEFQAHVGDFGLARFINHHKLDKTTLAAGTLGYMAPEIPYTGKATKESDVYSFGILVLEVICGRRPLDLQGSVEHEDLVLLIAVWQAHEVGALLNIVDPRLFETFQTSSGLISLHGQSTHTTQLPLFSLDSHNLINNMHGSIVEDTDIDVEKAMAVNLLHIGLLCCLPNPKARPSIKQVNKILQQIGDVDNVFSINNVEMPSLPTTKPLGFYSSLEFSQTTIASTSSAPSPSSLV